MLTLTFDVAIASFFEIIIVTFEDKIYRVIIYIASVEVILQVRNQTTYS